MKRKVCRQGVKAELKSIKGSAAPRDDLRRRWITARCWACMRCPKLLRSFALPMDG